MPKLDDQGWFPYGKHADVTTPKDLGREIAGDYGLDDQAGLHWASVIHWVRHAARSLYVFKRSAYMISTTEDIMRIVGHTDEITVCDCCGKKNLKSTVALERADGEVVFYGRDCAGAAVSGRKTRKNGELALIKARRMQHIAPVLEAINAALGAGASITEARDAGREAADLVSPIFRNVPTISLEDFLASAIDISHAGPEAQLIALQKLQSTVYRFIEQTREQIAEAGAEAGANAKNGASEIEKSSDF